ncbi:MAG: FAD-dependent oxidoreductase [Minisyncoccia bacterium]|jgi:NAD(P)H-nitrite reductase large subunit
MQGFKYLIIGGGAAGVSAADAIRQNNAAGSIAIVSDEPYMLYSRVMLSKPNFFLGKVPFDQVWLKGEEWYKDKNIAFLGGKTATALDVAAKTVSLSNGDKISYDKLLIATGVNTRKINIPGADKKGVHYLRSLEDGKAIMAGIKTAKHAVTVGGGFIGFEMADLMQLAGLDTTVIILEPYFWDPVLDEAGGLMIERAMQKAGVKIIKNAEIVEITGDKAVNEIVLKDGRRLPCEMIIYGIGTIANLDWLKTAGLTTHRGLVANEFMETSLPGVWTAGDIAEYKDLILGENVVMGNWVSAHEQGRIAGLGMAGKRQAFRFVSFYTTQGFDTRVAFVGDASPSPGRVVIPRGSPEIGSYARIILANGEVEGATLLNRTQEMGAISKLIERNIDVSARHKELGNADFDLKKLLE